MRAIGRSMCLDISATVGEPTFAGCTEADKLPRGHWLVS